jgi:hypothetical protein
MEGDFSQTFLDFVLNRPQLSNRIIFVELRKASERNKEKRRECLLIKRESQAGKRVFGSYRQ